MTKRILENYETNSLKGAYSTLLGENTKEEKSIKVKEEKSKNIKEKRSKRSFMLLNSTIQKLYELRYTTDELHGLSSIVDCAIEEYYSKNVKE